MTDLRHSVKRFDALPGAGPYTMLLSFGDGRGLLPDGLPTDLPTAWRDRDRVLRACSRHEGMWHAALGIKITRIVSQGYTLRGDVPRRVRAGYDVLARLPFRQTLPKLLRDYWSTNNGAWLEIVRASSAAGSRVLAVDHLDSRYCQPTGDPERPCIYWSADGIGRVLRAHQVIRLVHMARADREANGLGECAAEGAYPFIVELAAINRFLLEKVNGKRPLAIYLVAGAGVQNIEDGVRAAQQQADATEDSGSMGYHYMGAAIVPLPAADKAALLTIPLSELPNGFDETSRWDKCLLAYAKNLELDIQDLTPIRAGVGTATQSAQLHAKANQLDSFQDSLAAALQTAALAPGTTFHMGQHDLAEQLARAQLAAVRTVDYAQQVSAQIITAPQAAQLKADAGDIPQSFVAGPDTTPGTIITSEDNPASEGDGGDA